MAKTAVIEITLVKESAEILDVNLEKELFDFLDRCPVKLPWQDEIKRIEIR
ncbi:MAG: hypothetical protein ACQCN3_06715 [Candidatus Bathyarchaeia archaeon]|jgi:hypothetical protein